MKYQHFTARSELIFIKSIMIRWYIPWIVHETSTLLSSFSFATQNLVLRLLLLNLLWSIRRVQKNNILCCKIDEECYDEKKCGTYAIPKKSGLVRCLYVYIFFDVEQNYWNSISLASRNIYKHFTKSTLFN